METLTETLQDLIIPLTCLYQLKGRGTKSRQKTKQIGGRKKKTKLEAGNKLENTTKID